MKTAVAYLRRSTKDKQQYSLDRQRANIEIWARSNDVDIVSWFEESVSGKLGLEHRPQLVEAFASGLPVVVSSVDRLSRDVAIGASILKDRKVIVSDLGMDVDSLILNILLAVAQKEREMISNRVKEGLARAKARGVQLGGFSEEQHIKARKANRARGDKTVETYAPMINRARQAGARSSRQIAQFLNDFDVKSPRGGKISHKFVLRILAKMEG